MCSFFFIISGYLYFCNIDKFTSKDYVIKSKKRLGSLIIPYVIWNLIYALFYLGIAYMNGECNTTIGEFLKGFWAFDTTSSNGFASPYNGPFWFLRDLVVVSVISPIFYFFLRSDKFHVGICSLTCLGILYLMLPSYIIHIW